MSTKTTIKRIALVAAVAAAFGGLSTVAANATTLVTAKSPVFSGGTLGTWSSTSGTQVTGGLATVVLAETTTVGDTAATIGTFTSTGVGSIVAGSVLSGETETLTVPGSSVAVTFPTTSIGLYSGAQGSDQLVYETLTVNSSIAGTQTITFVPITSSGAPGSAVTATITWGAAPVVSAQYSTAALSAGATYAATATTADATVSAPSTLGTQAASVYVVLNSAASTPINGQGLSASITGPGTLSAITALATAGTSSAASAVGRAVSISAGGTNNNFGFAIWPDGTVGTSTITISSGSTVISTKTVLFTGSAKALTATQNLKILKAGGVTDTATSDVYSGATSAYSATTILNETVSGSLTVGTSPITVTTSDSSGNPVALAAAGTTLPTSAAAGSMKVVVSDSTVLTAGPCITVTASTTSTGKATNEVNCSVTGTTGAASGKSATATVELYNSTTSAFDILSAPMTFTIGGAVAKEVLSTDATQYTPGQPGKVIVTATDSAGNPAYDQDGTFVGSLVSSTYTASLTSPAYILGGTGSKTFYAPIVEGNFTLSGTDVTAALNPISVTATVGSGVSSNAANAATDAANQATDAANNAIDAANAAADTAQTAADAAQSAADTATQALAAAQDANQNATDALAAAQEATDAGNAATDAANAAADSADAATAAAQDASDKAAAALAAVTQLSAQFTTLAAQVAKVLTAVQAIAKATTPAKKK